MATVRLISYTLKKPGQNYSGLLDYIRSFPSWAKITESSYAVVTTLPPGHLRNECRRHMDQNDTITVSTMVAPWSAYERKGLLDWLEQELGPASS